MVVGRAIAVGVDWSAVCELVDVIDAVAIVVSVDCVQPAIFVDIPLVVVLHVGDAIVVRVFVQEVGRAVFVGVDRRSVDIRVASFDAVGPAIAVRVGIGLVREAVVVGIGRAVVGILDGVVVVVSVRIFGVDGRAVIASGATREREACGREHERAPTKPSHARRLPSLNAARRTAACPRRRGRDCLATRHAV